MKWGSSCEEEARTTRKDYVSWEKLVKTNHFLKFSCVLFLPPAFCWAFSGLNASLWQKLILFLFLPTADSSSVCTQGRRLGSPSMSLARRLTWLRLWAWRSAIGLSPTNHLLQPTPPTSSSMPAAALRWVPSPLWKGMLVKSLLKAASPVWTGWKQILAPTVFVQSSTKTKVTLPAWFIRRGPSNVHLACAENVTPSKPMWLLHLLGTWSFSFPSLDWNGPTSKLTFSGFLCRLA